ncbi:hypothetical protein SteCoe_17737 [Stentor coeruleus]|uniref:Response regulatory domain-containing protein n=1 Tax=Stentor coeruleus TaxID=5963 RepID=A0A1R2BYB1_9CILI|nr:hypothetical protein SteCoe_17737 [Stentor coeruleus]
MDVLKISERLIEEKSKDAMKFTRTSMKVLKGLAGFCLCASMLLKDPDPITLSQAFAIFTLLCFSELCTCCKRLERSLHYIMFWGLDLASLQAAYFRFPQYSGLFLAIATQLFIQGHLEYATSEYYGYILIVLNTLLWLIASFVVGAINFSAPFEIYFTIIFGTILRFFWLKFRFQRYTQETLYKIAISNHENNISALLQGIPEGIVVVDKNFSIKMHNSAYESIFQNSTLAETQYLKKRHNENYKKNLSLKEDVEQFFNSKNIKDNFGILCLGDIRIDCSAAKILWNDENAVVITFRDVTALIDMEKQIRKKSTTLKHLREVSHELKTPLNVIIHEQTEVLQNSKFLSEETKSQLNKSLSMSYVLLNSIRDILDFNQIQCANFKLCNNTFVLKSFIDECLTIAKFAFGDHDNKTKAFNLNIDPLVPFYMNTDKSRLRQVLVSLLTNPAAFQSESINVGIKRKGLFVRFVLKIFHKGLANSFTSGVKFRIASSIVEKISGKPLRVEIGPFVSVMKFDIADVLDNEESEIPDEGFAKWPLSLGRTLISKEPELIDILIVDDMEFNLTVLKRILENLHNNCKCSGSHQEFVVHTANSGSEAINMITKMNEKDSGYKIIIMDCQMPEMNGWEATKKIRQMFQNGEISILPYIIAYSAFDSNKDIEKCLKSGMSSHISKPCHHEELCKVLSEWLSKPIQKI